MRSARSVLVFSLPGIGDTLLGLSAIRGLKQEIPNARITMVTMFSAAADILRRFPEIDEVVNWDFPTENPVKSLLFVLGLRRRRYDACVLVYPANRLEYNVIAWLAGARIRLGHRYDHLDLLCGNWLNTMTVHEDSTLTNVEENLLLVGRAVGKTVEMGASVLSLETAHADAANRWLEARGLDQSRCIGFHPGSSTNKNHRDKRWPREHFAALGSLLAERANARILLFGGSDETELRREIAEKIGQAAVLVDEPDILNTAALMGRCDYFVSNDSSLLHLARFLNVPATGIFGPTNPDWVSIPGKDCHNLALGLPCQPCFYYSPRHLKCKHGDFRCLRDLKPESVCMTILERMGQR